jgi:hypothetical protein
LRRWGQGILGQQLSAASHKVLLIVVSSSGRKFIECGRIGGHDPQFRSFSILDWLLVLFQSIPQNEFQKFLHINSSSDAQHFNVLVRIMTT